MLRGKSGSNPLCTTVNGVRPDMSNNAVPSLRNGGMTIRPSARGYNSYRWYLPAHSDHGTGVSSTLLVRVY